MRKNYSWSDERSIGVHVWQKLKDSAMKDDYKEQNWYSKLNEEERSLLEELRTAQQNQGDMRPLEFRPNERLNILHKDAFTISREEMTERDLWDATCQKERTDVTQKEMFDNNKNRLLRTVFKEKAIMMRLVMRNPLMIDILPYLKKAILIQH